jgi:predicted dehydrogenase
MIPFDGGSEVEAMATSHASRSSIRVGIVGAGFAARFHLDALRRVYTARTHVAGIHSRREGPAGDLADAHGTVVFASISDLIDACDVVHICTPPATHEEIAIACLAAGRDCIVEKPFTGFFSARPGPTTHKGPTWRQARISAQDSIKRMLRAEESSSGRIHYAENWVYAPAIQKEREILEKSGDQILWMDGQESHSGSHSPYYGIWKHSGGGSIMGKGVHPLTAALYLKRVESRAKGLPPIRPQSVSARVHRVTALPGFRGGGFIRSDYADVEDYGRVHVVFSDGTIADIVATELVMGGVHNVLEVNAANHRSICNINPNSSMATFAPAPETLKDVYRVEKIETTQGWAPTAPDEDWMTGYYHEMNAFYDDISHNRPAECNSALAADTISVVYAAYESAGLDGATVEVDLEPDQ